jgi:uncharacterized RDD family membrane protein YckC
MNSDYNQNEPAKTAFDETMPTAAPGFIRFVNYMLDCIFLALVACLLISIFMPELMPKSIEDVSNGMFISFLYPLQFVYYFVAEFFFGKTLAKFFTRTYVTTEFNEKPGFTAIFFRTFCRYIPFEYISFLGNGIGWHDRLSKTYVVRNPK